MPVSSNTLFHFTNSLNHLYSILINDFIPHYSRERLYLYNEIITVTHPMVCFCDIPLSQIKEHLDRYGSYGIGLNKEWGIRKKLNPVLYVEKNSLIKSSIDSLYNNLTDPKQVKGTGEAILSLHEVFKYIKPYETDIATGEEYYKYYNEREWRYVSQSGGFVNENLKGRKGYYKQNEKLIFEPNDIRYLILKDETEIDELIDAIPVIKSRFEEKSKKRLISRIITCEQIGNDF